MRSRLGFGVLLLVTMTSGPAGCYLSHDGAVTRIDVAEDAGLDSALDGGRDVGRDAGRDAARDGGTDAPDVPACTLDPEDVAETFCTVTPTGELPAGADFELTVRWSSCRCETGRSCDVTVDGDVIDVRTRSCALDAKCDDCSFEGRCAVPALSEGSYRLRIDGVDAFDVEAERQPRSGRPRPRCYEAPEAPADGLECAYAWDEAVAPGRICYRELEDVGTYVSFVYTASCRSCFDWTAGCSVERSDGLLRVRPRAQACACPTCGACAEVCAPVEIECRSIALRDGDYDVVVELPDGRVADGGVLTVQDVAGPGPMRCHDIP